ncbi:MAG: hypothetical protein ACREYE_25670 [Gammaproteobacteria bacterium]
MPSCKRDIVESLLYAAILSLAASRRLLQALRQALPAQAPRLKEHRFAVLLAVLADDLLTIVIHDGRLGSAPATTLMQTSYLSRVASTMAAILSMS